jgi:hypothetical protein
VKIDTDDLLGTWEAVALAQCHRTQFFRAIQAGHVIPVAQLKCGYLFDRKAILKLIAAGVL